MGYTLIQLPPPLAAKLQKLRGGMVFRWMGGGWHFGAKTGQNSTLEKLVSRKSIGKLDQKLKTSKETSLFSL